MNNFVTILGVAAVATLTGCKDPNYQPMVSRSHYAVKPVQAEPVQAEPIQAEPIQAEPVPTEPTVLEPISKPAEPEYTMYIVQKGDFLAKISKKFNISIESIKQLNGLKGDKIRLGQKLKLPGKLDVGEQTVPEGAIAKPQATAKKVFEPYTGATVEYTVKSGDTLGAIAYGNGINIRQLKALNGLKNDNLKIGQKLQIPADGKAAKSAKAAPAEPQPVKAQPSETTVDEVPAEVQPEDIPPAPAAAETTYVVQEGEDLMSVSIASGVSLSTLRELNNLPEDAKLTAGQVLKIPAEE